jgi:hypothetical protein
MGAMFDCSCAGLLKPLLAQRGVGFDSVWMKGSPAAALGCGARIK